MGIKDIIKKRRERRAAKKIGASEPFDASAKFNNPTQKKIVESGQFEQKQAEYFAAKTTTSSGSSGSAPPTPTPSPTTTTTTVNKAGGVTQNGITYHGNTTVPNQGGLTANQLQAAALREAQKQYGSGVKRGGFTATYTSKQNTQRESDRQTEVKAIRNEVRPPTIRENFEPVNQGTQMYNPELNFDVKTKPYVERRTERYWTSPSGKNIPIMKDVYVDPLATGKQFERPATSVETQMLEDQRKMLSFETGTAAERVSTGDKIRQAGKDVEKYIGIDLSRESLGTQGRERIISEERIQSLKLATTDAYGGGKYGKVVGGIVTGFIPQTKGEIAGTILTAGIGAGVGFGIKGLSAAARMIPKYGTAASSVINTGAFVGGTALGGAYVYKAGQEVAATDSYWKKGEIVGGTGREFAAFGLGYGRGAKGFDIARGKRLTRGRTEIPIERLVPQEVLTGSKSFPTAPSSQHMKLFMDTTTKFPELTEGKPGGFHTTPDKFWKKSFTGAKGTSELPGTYVGSDVSIYFSGIKGKGYNVFPTIKSIIQPTGTPGIAFLKPKRFRLSPFSGGRKPKIVDGERIGGAKWKKPVEQGAIDIPRMKTEIEGVVRVNSGEYALTGQKYYTTFEGVRLPLDTFDYAGLTTKPKAGVDTGKSKGGRTRSISDYSYRGSDKISIIEPRGSYGKSTTRSISSPKVSSITSQSSMPKSSGIPSSSKSYSSSTSYSPGRSSGRSSSSRGRSSISSIISSGKSSYGRSSGRSSGGSSSISSIISSSKSPIKRTPPRFPRRKKGERKRRGTFGVQVRRGGIFKSVGSGLTLKQAQELGQQRVSQTLGATYKITGLGQQRLRTPVGFRTKATKEGTLFIERNKYRLSKKGEKREIQIAKRVARKPTKKKKKRGFFDEF